jgi:carboxypeptidase family protein
MPDNNSDATEPPDGQTSRRTLLKGAGVAGAAVWAVPVVQTLGMGSAAAAAGSPPPGGDDEPGTIQGLVVDAQTGNPITGAIVTVVGTGLGAVTGPDGRYTIPGVPPGAQTVQATATGYQTATQSTVVPAGGTVEVDFALSAVGDALRVVLAWGAEPSDLDLHMSGPDGDGGRFHVAYYNRTPTDFVTLDRDDTSSFGPETDTVTVSPSHGNTYVAGSYHVWVHNYSGSPEFDTSGATVTLFGPSGQVAPPYSVADATGNPADDLWFVVTFDLSSSGVVSNVAAQQVFQPGDEDTVL